jgi:hypothetical protein
LKFLSIGKDGGPKSTVTGHWFLELKSLFSVVLLRFDDGSRDEYHSHAFDSVSWVLKGKLWEMILEDVDDRGSMSGVTITHEPSLSPVLTKRDTLHRVVSDGTTWVLSFRGPWSKTWREYDPKSGKFSTLTHGRKAL